MQPSQITIPCLGYTIAADSYEQPGSSGVLLVLVGYSSSKARNASFVKQLVTHSGMNALVVDYSGHGESTHFELDQTSPAQHILETVTAFDWLKSHFPQSDISVVGTSYGGFMAANLTKYRAFERLALRTPAIYRPFDTYSLQPEIHKGTTTANYRLDSAALAQHPIFTQSPLFTGPVLLVVHQDDEVIPVQTTDIYREYFAADEYTVAGFKHAYSDPGNPESAKPAYITKLSSWLKQ